MDADWHGWAKGDVALHVGPYPGRSSLALSMRAKGLSTVLAYFRSEDDARRCMRWLDGELDADTVIAEVMGRTP